LAFNFEKQSTFMTTKIDVWPIAEQVLPEAPLSPLPGTPDKRLLDWREPFQNDLFQSGAVLLAVSAGLFVLFDSVIELNEGEHFGLFFMHYVMAFAWGAAVTFQGGWSYLIRHRREQQAAMWLVMVLWYVSAFALNRSMAVFEQSVPWLCWAVVGSSLAIVAHIWADLLPRWGQQLLYAALAGAFLLLVYQAVFLCALYGVSIPGLIVLGIGAHTFVPGAMAFLVGRQLWVGAAQRTWLRPAVSVGLAVPLLLLGLFVFNWQRTANRLAQVRVEASLRTTTDLPDWVLMAQQLVPNAVTDRLLKATTVYVSDPWSRSFGELRALDDVRLHDPLVVIAQTLFPATTSLLTDAEQTKLLRTVNQAHYGTESKFWSGRNLSTARLTTQVRIWPQYRLSYTEKTVVVRSSARWGDQEALYSFHLPEGSTVSALSLWIAGREEPARLTTQATADSAYRQVVGVESRVASRDPSVLTWQEGNRVTVRVFPVPAGQKRQFKIGITSPLRAKGGNLTYLNAWFDGPDANKADETIKLTFAQTPTDLNVPWLTETLTNNQLTHRDTHRARYRPDWRVSLAAPPLAAGAPFRLDGRTYAVRAYQPTLSAFIPADLYLDVNTAWTKNEFMDILAVAKKQNIANVWAFSDGLVRLTDANREEVFEALSETGFSLFPIDRIANPSRGLLITKGTASGPTLADLTGSTFSEKLTKQAATLQAPIRTLCLNDVPTPYLKTLAELRVLQLVTTDGTGKAATYLSNRQFPAQTETDTRAELPTAGIAITARADSSDVPGRGTADVPDHIARLFVYNQLMQRVGRHYFDAAFRNDASLASLAQQGHVVSPVSSLVVLETQEDYKRFDIKADKNGLDNATLKQDGAVPEPHEWAMMAVAAVLVLWQFRKKWLLL
jgi:XrtN system VIT domain protein